MATTLWRSEPQYCGHVADGWYQAADGRLQYRPAPDLEDLRRRLDKLIGDEPPTLVRAVAIGSVLPMQEQIEQVIGELNKAPRDELREWRALGGTVDVIAGADARRHPKSPINIIAGPHCGGWYSHFQKRIVVAADSRIQPPVIALHELGHGIDHIHQLSQTRYWQNAIGRPDPGHNGNGMGEQFAESFGRYYHGEDTLATLSREVQEFFRETFT